MGAAWSRGTRLSPARLPFLGLARPRGGASRGPGWFSFPGPRVPRSPATRPGLPSTCRTAGARTGRTEARPLRPAHAVSLPRQLCYDYKFDFEDDQHKIPCHCGAVNCRKWMN